MNARAAVTGIGCVAALAVASPAQASDVCSSVDSYPKTRVVLERWGPVSCETAQATVTEATRVASRDLRGHAPMFIWLATLPDHVSVRSETGVSYTMYRHEAIYRRRGRNRYYASMVYEGEGATVRWQAWYKRQGT